MATPSEAQGLCPDWMLSSSSNVHVARDRGWFSTSTPFPTFTSSYITTSRQEVLGIGDVHLPVELLPDISSLGVRGTLHLRNVLHMPTSVCNVVGGPDTGDYDGMRLGGLGDQGKDAEITTRHGQRLGYFVNRGRWVLQLCESPHGPVVGPSMFEPGTAYMINATWPDSERRRWAAAQAARGLGPDQGANGEALDGGQANVEAAPYTEKEKDWLKRNWGDEFHFFTAYALSVYKEEDREEGRRIARAMMEADEAGNTNI